jgi:hypothetical protein
MTEPTPSLLELIERARLVQRNPNQLALFDGKEITVSNVVAQTQLEKVLVSTVEISSMTRMMDTLIEAVVPDGMDRPGLKTKATEFQFETMVFSADSDGVTDWDELDCERYNSREDAQAGHTRMVEKWMKQNANA